MSRESNGPLIATLTVMIAAAVYVLIADPADRLPPESGRLRDAASYDLVLAGSRLWALSAEGSKTAIVILSDDNSKAGSSGFEKRWWTQTVPVAFSAVERKARTTWQESALTPAPKPSKNVAPKE